jgi:prevent-host-death family protein
MRTVNMHEAKSQLSALVQQALDGEDVVIARAGRPLVRLVPFQEAKAPRQPGRLKGQIRLADDFDAVDGQIAELFEQGS